MKLDDFAQHLRDNDLTRSTVEGYCREVQQFSKWFELSDGQPLTPAGLTPSAVSEYKAYLQAVKRNMPATVNRKLLALRAWGEWAVASGQLEANPASKVKLLGEEQLQPKSLSHRDLYALRRQVEKAVNNARTDPARFLAVRNLAIYRVLERAGLRVGELCGLQLDDLEMSERKGALTVRHGKGNKRRSIPLGLPVREALAEWLKLRPTAPDDMPLFSASDGAALKPRAVQRMIEEAARRAGVEASPHTLRHTFAKSLLNAGEPAENVAVLLGHSKLETTWRYLQPSERDLEKAIERLED